MSRTIFGILLLIGTSLVASSITIGQPIRTAGPSHHSNPVEAAPRDWLAYLPAEHGGGNIPYAACQTSTDWFMPGSVDGYGSCCGDVSGYTPPAGCRPEPAGCYPNAYTPWADMCQAAPPLGSVCVSGLLLNLDLGDHYYFSYDDANEVRQLTDWHDTAFEWDGAFEIAARCYDDCLPIGFEAVYWQLLADPVTTTTSATDVAGNLNGILNWDQLDYNSTTADTYVNNALVHRLRREVELQNAELNYLACLQSCGCSTTRVLALVGPRFLRYEDQMQFAADTFDSAFTHASEEIYYNIEVENLLFGVQAGMWSEFCLGHRWRFVFGAKAGAFGNHLSAKSQIGGAAGIATVNNGPNIGRRFDVDADKTDLAMLGELECDLVFAITPRWHVGLGYRVIGLSGVAVSVDQIYHDLRGLQDVEQIDSDGTLLVHGARAYAECRF